MANLLTRKEFGSLVGLRPQNVGTYIKRGDLIEIDKRIDTDDTTNKGFIAKFAGRQANKTIEGLPSTSTDVVNSDGSVLSVAVDKTNVDFVQKQHQIEKLKVEVNLKNLEIEKKKGRVLPLDFVVEWSCRNLKGTFAETINFANSIIEDICNKSDLPIETKLEFKKKFKQGFNEVVLSSIENQTNEALDYAKEYALINKW